jgi:hypothetical protein
MVTDYVTEQWAIQGEIEDITAKLGDPAAPANIDELVQRRATLQEKLKIIAGRKAKAENDQYRAGIEARQAKFRRELDEELAELREILPRLRYRLAGLQLLEGRLEEGGANWVELTDGLPFGAAGRLSEAIAREVAGSDTWETVYTPDAVARLLDAGRAFAARRAEERAAKEAAAEEEFNERLALFQAGKGPDPRIVTYRVRAG